MSSILSQFQFAFAPRTRNQENFSTQQTIVRSLDITVKVPSVTCPLGRVNKLSWQVQTFLTESRMLYRCPIGIFICCWWPFYCSGHVTPNIYMGPSSLEHDSSTSTRRRQRAMRLFGAQGNKESYNTVKFVVATVHALQLNNTIFHYFVYFNTLYRASFVILYNDQQMHNYFTNYHTPTSSDTIVLSTEGL